MLPISGGSLRARANSRRGSSVIEATLVHMLLLVIFFSIFDFGYVMFEHHTILNQVRGGARYGAINPDDLVGTRNMVLYSQPNMPDAPPSLFGMTPAMVNVSRAGQSTPEDRIVIVVSGYQYMLVTPGMAGVFTGKPIEVSMPVETQ